MDKTYTYIDTDTTARFVNPYPFFTALLPWLPLSNSQIPPYAYPLDKLVPDDSMLGYA